MYTCRQQARRVGNGERERGRERDEDDDVAIDC